MSEDGTFVIVLNARSGSQEADEAEATIRRVLEAGGRRVELLRVEDPRQLARKATEAVQLAERLDAAIVAAGGDGTLNALVQEVLPAGRSLGVIPRGTFNYLARTYEIPLETEAAARALLAAQPRPVQVGRVNGRVFLINASLGLYPKLLEDREAFKQRHGRSRLAAFQSGLLTLMREHGQLLLRVDQDGKTRVLRTPTLVIGNNPLQLERIGIEEAPAVRDGRLVAVAVKPVSTPAMLGLALRGALGRLGDAESIVSFAFHQMTVRPGLRYGRARMKVAIDGETLWAATPLVFEPAPQPLRLLLAPAPA